MKERITRINRTLFELWTGILIFGVICQVFVFACRDKAPYSLGLWIGILTAMCGAFHMWYSLNRALDLEERAAARKISVGSVVRYAAYAAILAVTALSGQADPLMAFLGLMGLKIGAYLNPVTKKISRLIYGEEILPSLAEETAGEQDK